MKLEIVRKPLTFADLKPGEYFKLADPEASKPAPAMKIAYEVAGYDGCVEADGRVLGCLGSAEVIRCSGFAGIPTNEQQPPKLGTRFGALPAGAAFCYENLIYFKDDEDCAYCPASGRVEVGIPNDAHVQELTDVTLKVSA